MSAVDFKNVYRCFSTGKKFFFIKLGQSQNFIHLFKFTLGLSQYFLHKKKIKNFAVGLEIKKKIKNFAVGLENV